MFESLVKHQKHLEQAVVDDDVSRLAKTARGELDSQSAVFDAEEQLNQIVRLLSGGKQQALFFCVHGSARSKVLEGGSAVCEPQQALRSSYHQPQRVSRLFVRCGISCHDRRQVYACFFVLAVL
jgi:hypothetical protein